MDEQTINVNDKTGELLTYLAEKHPNPTVTVLMKLCYLIDLVSMKKYGGKVTDFNYIRYKFGPFDKKIYSYLERLATGGLISQEQGFAAESANDFIVYSSGPTPRSNYQLFAGNDKEAADTVLQEVAGYGAKALTDIAYKTKPMIALGATRGGIEGLYQQLNLNT